MAMIKIGDLVLYDVKELSKLLDVQEKTIRALLRDGKLKGRKLARKWYVTEESLREYFEQPAEDPWSLVTPEETTDFLDKAVAKSAQK